MYNILIICYLSLPLQKRTKMETTHRIQTAFRLDESLLRRLKKKARGQKKSLNSYVEALLMADVRDEPEFPKLSLPVKHSPRVTSLLGILPPFSEQELQEDDKLAYILGK